MNIIGEGFPDAINNQIIQRQKVYGSGYINNRSSEEIVYLNGNTSWCKLVSSVNIVNPAAVKNDTIKSLGLGGNTLAKQFVLFNGTTADNNSQREGITYSNSTLGNNHAYGIGGTEFGIRPMMGIQSAEIKHENRGSIRRASVKIKAWNKKQFDIIDVLYLRLGFDILLEWGHSMYYNNSGGLSRTDNSLATEFLNGGITYQDFLKKIQEKRLSSQGNYDAMFAKVCNIHWSYMPDGSYDISLDLVSIGDVMESFKINVLASGVESVPQAQDVNEGEEKDEELKNINELDDWQFLTLSANKHSIGQYLYKEMAKENLSHNGEPQSETQGGAQAETPIDVNISTGALADTQIPQKNKLDLNIKREEHPLNLTPSPPGEQVPPGSYTDDEYKAFAETLFDEFNAIVTDDDVVLEVFSKMKTSADLQRLANAYGVRNVDPGGLNNSYKGDLNESIIQEYLKGDERENYEKIKEILIKNGAI